MTTSKAVATGALMGGIVIVGWGVWEMTKWGFAIAAAPETGGVSLLAALVAP